MTVVRTSFLTNGAAAGFNVVPLVFFGNSGLVSGIILASMSFKVRIFSESIGFSLF